MSDNIYKDMMNQVEPSNGLNHKIACELAAAVEARRPTSHMVQRKYKFHPLLVAASILIVVAATTALAYGEEIRQFMFGGSSITQVGEIENTFNLAGVPIREVHIINGRYPQMDWPLNFEGWEKFSSQDELGQAAAFDVKTPGYLPETVDLNSISIYGAWYTSEKHIEFVFIEYGGGSSIGNGVVALSQWYAGPDASFEIVTIYPIEKVMVNDAEAFLIIETIEENMERAILYWKQGSVLYELQYTVFDGMDLDILIAIAESI